MRNKIFLFLLVGLNALSWARPYRHYLDPRRAEQTLAGIALRPRISEQEWLGIIRGQRNEQYTVRPGDNLWNISRKLFGDAWLWRKMWEVNQSVTNPHDLTVGRMLAYYSETEPSEMRIALVKLAASKRGGANDIDNDRFINVDIKQRHRVTHFLFSQEEVLGEISGSFSPRHTVGLEEGVYVRFFDESKVRIGESYIIAQEDRAVSRFGEGENAVEGTLMRTVGEVKLTVKESLVRAEVTGIFHPIRRGDKIISMQRTVNWAAPQHPPDGLSARILLGEFAEKRMFGQGALVLLDKGEQDGMKPGYLFRVLRDTDPVLGSQQAVSPHFKGEVQIVFANGPSSLGYITRNSDPIFVGDTLIPRQAIADPPPPATRPNDTIEIN